MGNFGLPDAFALLNLCVSSGLLLYAVKIEHRFTKLETKMEILMTERKSK